MGSLRCRFPSICLVLEDRPALWDTFTATRCSTRRELPHSWHPKAALARLPFSRWGESEPSVLLQCIAGSPASLPDTKAVPLLKASCSAGEQWVMLLSAVQTTTASAVVGQWGSSLPRWERDGGGLRPNPVLPRGVGGSGWGGCWRRGHLGCALPTSPPNHYSPLPLQQCSTLWPSLISSK